LRNIVIIAIEMPSTWNRIGGRSLHHLFDVLVKEGKSASQGVRVFDFGLGVLSFCLRRFLRILAFLVVGLVFGMFVLLTQVLEKGRVSTPTVRFLLNGFNHS